MDTVQGMRTFAAVAANQSFTEGARRVGISTKLASKYVAQLEERLGAQLFNRTTRSVTLTETGRAYYDRCVPLLEQFDELEGLVQVKQSELAGRIRITAPTGFGSSQLVRMLKPFQAAHPKVFIELHLSDHHVSIIEEGYDLAVRFGDLKDSSLVARRLLDMRIVCCASPDYLDQHGEPKSPAALATHNCLLRTFASTNDSWEFKTGSGIQAIPVSGSFRANSPLAVANMAADGLGIGRIPYYTVLPFLETGKLKILFEKEEARVVGLYAVYPPSRHLTARIRALIDHLAAHV
ncbi:LysR family transcriptional regulator [Parasedimentitalea maritima]|uniref:LysR family transcriptional regulator n=1 Tax=Parasedimentitalea maritima TaxID=2578117 RepID=A0A5R8YWK2_9RHOB|nr:LysR family transcriptional regulator [Zongyanglinia marina]KAE9625961.1 LysR family transcriptional regulator [Zongyanglinia marina]TLP57644.1 LysR family transcriptional regulator [Zongyanglinia marina]